MQCGRQLSVARSVSKSLLCRQHCRDVHKKCISKILKSSTRESNVACRSQKLMLECGLIQASSSGIYHFLPLGNRALEKLTALVDWHMSEVGGQKVTLPCLTPGMLWKATDRWTTTGPELMKFSDRHGSEYLLGPTHEEVVTNLVASQGILSYKLLPLKLYQIGRKFRDEMKPRFGLLRSREFIMKDMYTFDIDEAAATVTYDAICDAYSSIFRSLNVNVLKVVGSTGNIGGSLSHEFHLPAAIGEDTIFYCAKCSTGINRNVAENTNSGCASDRACPTCNAPRDQLSGIEVAHTFFLGEKYSKVFMASCRDSRGRTRLTHMGCYGIGVSRLLAAILETATSQASSSSSPSSEGDYIKWPSLLAPYQVCIIPPKAGSHEAPVAGAMSDVVYATVSDCLPNEVVFDDRTELTIGRRLSDARKIGFPFVVIAGKKAAETPPLLELHAGPASACGGAGGKAEFVTQAELIDRLSQVKTVQSVSCC